MNLRQYWIDEIKKTKEFQAIANTEEYELLRLENAIQALIDDQFIETATETGIARREKVLKIQPFADDSLDSRRFRINALWNNKLPYTYRQFIKRLSNLVGETGFAVSREVGEYTITVKISLGVKRMLDDANKLVRNVVPANMIISVELLYNRHIDLEPFTHLQLEKFSHNDMWEEVLY